MFSDIRENRIIILIIACHLNFHYYLNFQLMLKHIKTANKILLAVFMTIFFYSQAIKPL